MKFIILFLLSACNFDVNHKGIKVPEKFKVDVPQKYEVKAGYDLEQIKEYCIGKVEYEEAKKQEINPSFSLSDDEFNMLVGDCYYGFDLSGLNIND